MRAENDSTNEKVLEKQKVVFYLAKGYLLQGERLSFTQQKATFYNIGC